MSFDSTESDAYYEGRQARKAFISGLLTPSNPYNEGTTEYKDYAEGFAITPEPLLLEDVTVVTPPGVVPINSPFGYVITEDGRICALLNQYYHGVVCSILYPELAKQHSVGLPFKPKEENASVLAYQSFELEMASKMNVIRVAISTIAGCIYFSKSPKPANNEQIQSVLAVCKALGYGGRDKFETDHGRVTVAQLIDKLREGDEFLNTGAQDD